MKKIIKQKTERLISNIVFRLWDIVTCFLWPNKCEYTGIRSYYIRLRHILLQVKVSHNKLPYFIRFTFKTIMMKFKLNTSKQFWYNICVFRQKIPLVFAERSHALCTAQCHMQEMRNIGQFYLTQKKLKRPWHNCC